MMGEPFRKRAQRRSQVSTSDSTRTRVVGGEYVPDATIIRIGTTVESVLAAQAVLQAREAELQKGIPGAEMPITLDTIKPVLTRTHELDHFRIMQSTPFGLLLWRLWQCLAVSLSFLE